MKELHIILKADVQGSVEVLTDTADKLSNDKVRVKVLRSGVGAITETDVLLASASNAIIIGFNVRPERKAQELAEQEKVDIRLHSIIYELQDEIKRAMTGLLEPDDQGNLPGPRRSSTTRSASRRSAPSPAATCPTASSSATPKSACCATTASGLQRQGRLARRFKDDASEVRNGMECGISIAELRRHQSRRRDRSLRDRESGGRSNSLKAVVSCRSYRLQSSADD